MNEIVKFSPLIANLISLRDFLTCNRSKAASQSSKIAEPEIQINIDFSNQDVNKVRT
jgi:hypothetical protein